eukprot:3414571-Pyramimonas_sp.AAC.1
MGCTRNSYVNPVFRFGAQPLDPQPIRTVIRFVRRNCGGSSFKELGPPSLAPSGRCMWEWLLQR